jgi:glycosyltransferase involved in cell wall biosynthesis
MEESCATSDPARDAAARDEGLRIALVVNDSRMGGSERQALLLAGALRRRAVHPILLSLAGEGPVIDAARLQGIDADAVQLRYPLSAWYFPLNWMRAGNLFRRHRPRVIMGYTSVPNLYAGWLRRAAGARRFIWGQRNAGLDRPPRFMESVAARAANAFIANSPAGIEFVRRVFPAAAGRIHCIPNAVDWPFAAEPRAPAAAAPVQVVCVAHGRYPKDHETLLRAWTMVQQRLSAVGNSAARLTLAGCFDQGDHAARIRELAARPPLEATVRFAGTVADMPSLLRQSDVGVLCSRSEGMPNAILESMAAGLPVVATDLPGIRQALGDDAGHWLTAVGDADGPADRLLELIRDPALRATWGRRNRERALGVFSPDALAERTLAVVRGMAGCAGRQEPGS